MSIQPQQQEIKSYMERARQMLTVARHNLDDGFYSSSINRSYYAIFYAANALLATLGLSRQKHSGVLSIFRQYFVKTGIIEAVYSNIYGRLFDDRQASDYDIFLQATDLQAQTDLFDATQFVERVEQWLKQASWL